MKLFISLLPLLLTLSSFSQTQNVRLADLKLLEKSYQECISNGDNMKACSQTFYIKVDSLLNKAYQYLQHRLDPTLQTTLKKEQLAWLKKRDLKFKEIDSNTKKGMDEVMFNYDAKASFVKERVEVLIKRIPKS